MRPDNRALVVASRVPLGAYATDHSSDYRFLYDQGEYVPGKDKYLVLCDECPFEDCIRAEGDYSAYRAPAHGVKQYYGCPVWEQAKIDYEKKVKSGKPKELWREWVNEIG